MRQSLGRLDDTLQAIAFAGVAALFLYVWYLAVESAGWVVGIALGWIPAGISAALALLAVGWLFTLGDS